jgi:IS5 family transposase
MANVVEIAKAAVTAYNEKDWNKARDILAADAVYGRGMRFQCGRTDRRRRDLQPLTGRQALRRNARRSATARCLSLYLRMCASA